MSNNKTQGLTALSLQMIDAGSVVVGPTISLPTHYRSTFFIHLAKVAINDFVGYIEARVESKVGSFWYPVATYSMEPTGPTLGFATASVSAGASTITLASVTGFAVGNEVFIRNRPFADPNNVTGAEWNRIKGISGTTITLENPLTNTFTVTPSVQDVVLTNKAEQVAAQVDLTGLSTARVLIDACGGLEQIAAEAWLVRLDDP
jgi:hypothetical protein